MPRILGHDWPGNARELRNVIERAMIFLTDGGGLKIDPLGPGGSGSSLSAEGFLRMPKGLTLEEVERLYILDTLQETGGGVEAAAGRLGVTRKVLWSRRKKLGLLRDDGES